MKQDHQIKKWIASWDKANDSLKAVKNAALQDKTYYEKNRDLLNSMLQYAFDQRTIRTDSGLVTQQRLFKLIHLQSQVKDDKHATAE